MNLKVMLIVLSLCLGLFLRFYQLESLPPGLNVDEASHAYNAYSILKTGEDRYGRPWPLTFRSFGTYLLPAYTYLTVVPVAFFGLTIFSGRFIAVVSGVLLLIITYFYISEAKIFPERMKWLSVLVLSISPWAVFFSRGGHEASLSVSLFAAAVLFFVYSLKNPKWLILSFLTAGLSGQAYYAERYLAFLFFPVAIWIFKDKFLKHKKIIFIGILIFIITQLPQFVLSRSDALTRRIEQVNYWNTPSFNQNGGYFKLLPLGQPLYITKEFVTHYIEYFSPRSLFFDADPQRVRSMPDLSIFYIWMIVPLWFGAGVLFMKTAEPAMKVLILLLVLAPVPAALTNDPFYSIRTLTFFWAGTIILSLGCDYLLNFVRSRTFRIFLILVVVLISLVSFYKSYFILLKHERSDIDGFEYLSLVERLKNYQGRKVVVDSSRATGAHIWIPFYAKIDPAKFQQQTSADVKNNYYNNTNLDSVTRLDNFEIRAISWKDDIYKDEIIVGDSLAISDQQIKEHNLTPLFQIVGLDSKVKLEAYETHPEITCKLDFQRGFLDNPDCQKFAGSD